MTQAPACDGDARKILGMFKGIKDAGDRVKAGKSVGVMTLPISPDEMSELRTAVSETPLAKTVFKPEAGGFALRYMDRFIKNDSPYSLRNAARPTFLPRLYCDLYPELVYTVPLAPADVPRVYRLALPGPGYRAPVVWGLDTIQIRIEKEAAMVDRFDYDNPKNGDRRLDAVKAELESTIDDWVANRLNIEDAVSFARRFSKVAKKTDHVIYSARFDCPEARYAYPRERRFAHYDGFVLQSHPALGGIVSHWVTAGTWKELAELVAVHLADMGSQLFANRLRGSDWRKALERIERLERVRR